MVSIASFRRSLKHAWRGLKVVAQHEHSFRVQLVGLVVVIIVILLVPLAHWEEIVLILLAAAVLVLEVINSIFERIADGLKPRLSPIVKDVNDMRAGAVLITAVASAVIAIMILAPHVAELF